MRLHRALVFQSKNEIQFRIIVIQILSFEIEILNLEIGMKSLMFFGIKIKVF